MLRLFKYLKAKDYLALVVAIILIVFGVMLDLKLPDYMSDLTKLFYSPNYQLSDVALPGIKMLLCAVGSGIISAIVGFLSAVLSSNFAKYVRYALFSKVLSLSPSEIDNFSTASLITRTTNDVTQMQMTIAMGMQVMVRAPITAVLAIIKIIDKGTTGWVMATGISVGVLIIVLAIIVSLCLPRFRKVQRLTDAVNGVSRENLTGLRVIKAFNAEKYQLNKFEKVNTDLTKNNLFTSVATALLNPLMMLIMNGLSLAIYWIGAYTINNAVSLESQEQIFSNMIVFSSYAMQVVMAFLLLVAIFMIVPRAMVSGKRINQVLRTKIDIKEGSFNKQTEIKGELEFKHVSFSYNDEKDEDNEEVLQDISFKVEKGKTLAFIGATGSGKSTLVNLAVRFYDPDQGEILLDGVNIKDYTFKNLYNRFGYVSQKSIMFNGSVKENIFYGQSLAAEDEENLLQSLNVSQAEEFVNSKPGKEEYIIEQGGKNLSGGQKQRLSIARAIARKPEILIFDDSFSALDYKTDLKVRTLLNEKMKDTTKIIVAQRIGTIKNADEIIVLDEGKIVGKGTHEELLKNCKVYQEIALSQLDKEEL